LQTDRSRVKCVTGGGGWLHAGELNFGGRGGEIIDLR
jgi:hypothetical protein